MAPTTRDTHVAREVGTPKLETQTGQFSFGGPLLIAVYPFFRRISGEYVSVHWDVLRSLEKVVSQDD